MHKAGLHVALYGAYEQAYHQAFELCRMQIAIFVQHT